MSVCWACSDSRSDVDLIRDLYRIIDFDAELPDRALDLGVPPKLGAITRQHHKCHYRHLPRAAQDAHGFLPRGVRMALQ